MRKFALLCCVAVATLALPSFAVAQQTAQQWESVGEIDGVDVAKKKVPGSNLFMFKGEIVADVHIGRIISIFGNPDERSKWVSKYANHRTLERGEGFEKYWIHFAVPFPASDRDYVLYSRGQVDAQKRVFTCKIESIEHDEAPENDCCVRALANGTFYRFEALPGKKPRTRLYVEVHTDPKGMLPGWLVNMIQKKWPSETLNGLVREATRGGVPIHPKFADWYE